MNDTPSLLQLVQKILHDDPRIGFVLAEILGPPPGLGSIPVKPWEGV